MAGRGVDINLGGQEPEKDSAEYEAWKIEHKKVIDAGGLLVIGTERHESRRIDNQLRGRAGRQGDPGVSRFFVSMEDDLMRIFGGDRMKSVMTTLNVPEDMPIENSLISRSIESAQKKVEGNNFDIRKHLVEYDDVLNKHREAIYRRRKEILKLADFEKKAKMQDVGDGKIESYNDQKKKLSDVVLEFIENEIEQVVSFHTSAEYIKDWNLAEIYEVMKTIYPVGENLQADISKYVNGDNHKLDKAEARTEIIVYLVKEVKERYFKMGKLATEAGFNFADLEKSILIRSIDTLWVEHLEAISSVRQGIGLRGYGQRDPLVEYKKEAYMLFNELNSLIQKEVVYSIFKVGNLGANQVQQFSAPGLMERAKNFMAPAKTASENTASFSGFKKQDTKNNSSSTFTEPKQKVKNEAGKKVGRNDPCPCGSGKKFKKCCGR